jgi:hypothetical protein
VANQYREHPTVTCHLVDEQIVPVPETSKANTTVWFGLPREPGRDQVWEGLLAEHREGDDHAIVLAVPLFAYDLSFGDGVAVMPSGEGSLVVAQILSDAGNYTFRIWLEDADPATIRQLATEFGEMGCYVEGYSDQLLGLSCPRDLAQSVADALSAGEEQRRFEYETGRQRTH